MNIVKHTLLQQVLIPTVKEIESVSMHIGQKNLWNLHTICIWGQI